MVLFIYNKHMKLSIFIAPFILSFLFLTNIVFAAYATEQLNWSDAPVPIYFDENSIPLDESFLTKKEELNLLLLRLELNSTLEKLAQLLWELRNNEVLSTPSDVLLLMSPSIN